MKKYYMALFLLIFICNGFQAHAQEKVETKILISLWENKLYLQKDGKTIESFPIAPGKSKTPTPVGDFKVVKKGKNWGTGFGTRWLGLNVPWGTYGIHGTNRPYLIGQGVSHGCIRMRNSDVEKLYLQVPLGTEVIIDGPITGQGKWTFRNLSVGSKGSLVMLLQNHLRAAGIYEGPCDGIYGMGTKEAVTKFQKKNNLPVSGHVGKAEYMALGWLE